MVKDDTILIRIEADAKERFTAAASSRGESLTAFILKACISRAKSTEKSTMVKTMARASFGGVPSYFRGLCFTASQGGEFGYDVVGQRFAQNLPGMVPYDVEDEAWAEQVQELESMINEDGDPESVVDWFEEYFPKCMDLVPPRRRERFAIGVIEHVQKNGFG